MARVYGLRMVPLRAAPIEIGLSRGNPYPIFLHGESVQAQRVPGAREFVKDSLEIGRKETMTKRVLVADDSMLMRQMIGDTLEAAGWEIVAQAANGQQAVDAYQQFRPDAVTMDIVMPGTSGMFALQEILRLDPQAKIVVVSALSQTKLISEAIRNGAQDFIAKPFLPEQLQETMNGCLTAGVGA